MMEFDAEKKIIKEYFSELINVEATNVPENSQWLHEKYRRLWEHRLQFVSTMTAILIFTITAAVNTLNPSPIQRKLSQPGTVDCIKSEYSSHITVIKKLNTAFGRPGGKK